MKISKEHSLSLKISIILLIFAFLVTDFFQYMNHFGFITMRGNGGIGKYLIYFILSIFIYFVSYILANITIKPIEENNKKLKEYNHNLAHEIKTPLAVILSNLELLELEYDKEIITSSKEEVNNIKEITDNLLFLSENSELKNLEKINISKIIEKFGNEITLVNKGDFIIYGNVVLIERLFNNLIENAKKYKKVNSKIEIILDKNIIKISNLTSNNISLENTDKLFETFYKIDNSRNTYGYGLGLSIVKKICDLHKLNINIDIKNNLFTVNIFR